MVVTARKRNLRRLCFYTCLSFCSQGRCGIPACIAGGIPACLAAGGWYPSIPCRFPGPHPGGKLRGLAWGGVSRPTPEGGVSRPTWGRSPGPHLGSGVFHHALRQTPPHDGYCCGQLASYWNAFLLFLAFCSKILGSWQGPKNGTLSFYEMQVECWGHSNPTC